MSTIIKADFRRERSCKSSVRYQPVDEIGESISKIIYINNEALAELSNPQRLTITLEVKQ